MPEWESRNGRRRLSFAAEQLTGRFAKDTGEISYQATNTMFVYEDRDTGERRTIVAERATISEDGRYVYFRTSGRQAEETEIISRPTESVLMYPRSSLFGNTRRQVDGR